VDTRPSDQGLPATRQEAGAPTREGAVGPAEPDEAAEAMTLAGRCGQRLPRHFRGSDKGVLTMRWILVAVCALLMGNGYVSSQEASHDKTITDKHNKTEQKQTATKNESTSIQTEKSNEVKDTSHKAETHTDEKLKIDREIANYTGQLADFTKWLVIVTAILAGITAGLIYVGVRQELHLRDTARKELRAYLTIADGSLYFLPNDVLRAEIKMVNSGKTPAHEVTPAIYGECRDPINNEIFETVSPMRHKQPIAPGSHWTVGYEFGIFSEEQKRELLERKKLVFVWGRITFKDIFGKEQEINFRFRNVVTEIVPTKEGFAVARWFFYPEERGNNAT
jgi:hypothetical protein